ncbi:MAG: hypothetical protein AB7F40_04500 [Victivallaceae bacterium]
MSNGFPCKMDKESSAKRHKMKLQKVIKIGKLEAREVQMEIRARLR